MSDPGTRAVFLSHLASTLFMTGLIWFVQVVHYPLFDGVGGADFAAYERRHRARTTLVVGPPMLLEAATAVALFWIRPAGAATGPLVAGLALLALIWGSTAFLQVPCHGRLTESFAASVHRRLVVTNWIRTAAWSVRALLILWIAWSALS